MSLQAIDKTIALVKRIGSRTVSHDTMRRYKAVFVRMWRQKNLDPLRAGQSRDSYQFRKAALHGAGAWWLGRLAQECYDAADRQDLPAARRWSRILVRVLSILEPAIARDQPLAPGTSALGMPPSRWNEIKAEAPKRGCNSKRYALAELPRDWQDHVWNAVDDKFEYKRELAAIILMPLRPEELTRHEMPWGFSPGVIVQAKNAHCVSITVDCAKWPRKTGDANRVIAEFDALKAGAAALFLHAEAEREGGKLLICFESKDSFRRSICDIGKAAFPDMSQSLSPSVYRHQAIADLKATFGAGEIVAAAGGHRSDRMQSKYGFECHGRKRYGIISIKSLKMPRTGNIERAHLFGRWHRPPVDPTD